jgi:ankyrin repeat protein
MEDYKTKAFQRAIVAKNTTMALNLLKGGADSNAFFENNQTALMKVIAGGDTPVELLKLLIEKSTTLNTLDSRGESALIYVVTYWKHTPENKELVSMMIDRGADVNVVDSQNRPLLQLVLGSINFPFLKLFIEKGAANINAKNGRGTAILAMSILGLNDRAVEYLIEKGADVNVKNSDGETPIMLVEDNEETLQRLIEAGADINATNNRGETALMLAVKNGFYESLSLLLMSGADKTIKNANGKTAIDLTRNEDIIDLLKVEVVANDKWTGHTKDDLALLNQIIVDKNNWSMCPICLEWVDRIDGCMYMKHLCDKKNRHPGLFIKYSRNPYGTQSFVEWCVHCSKVSLGHTHLVPTTKARERGALQYATITAVGNDAFFASDCTRSGGVGKNGKLQVISNIIKFACAAQASIGKPYAMVRAKLIEDIWNAGANREVVPEITSLDLSCFSDTSTASRVEVPVIDVPRPPDEAGHPPIKHDTGDCVVEMGPHDDGRAVWQFDHKQPDGTFFKHTNYICGEDLEETLKGKAVGDIGKCWEPTACRGKLYPEELTDIVSEAYVGQYRKFFNQNMANQAGGSAPAGIFRVGTAESSCPLPPKKKAGKRKTYRKRGKKTTRRKKKTYRRVKMDS